MSTMVYVESDGYDGGYADGGRVGKCSWNNRLEAGVQLRPGALT